MTVPEARENERLRRYGPRTMRFPVGNRSLRIEIPAAREWLRKGTWANSMGRAGEPPYWVEVWPASMTVVWALARADRLVRSLRGVRVLDLGCGLGLPGVAAASLGAAVTFCDREADALAFAQWNGSRVLGPGGSVETVCADWEGLAFDRSFDVIVLADVTYRALYHGRLLELIESALAPGGVVVHADPEREESMRFLRWLGSGSGGPGPDGAALTVARGIRTTRLGTRQVDVRLAVAGAPAPGAQGAPGAPGSESPVSSVATWAAALALESPGADAHVS